MVDYSSLIPNSGCVLCTLKSMETSWTWKLLNGPSNKLGNHGRDGNKHNHPRPVAHRPSSFHQPTRTNGRPNCVPVAPSYPALGHLLLTVVVEHHLVDPSAIRVRVHFDQVPLARKLPFGQPALSHLPFAIISIINQVMSGANDRTALSPFVVFSLDKKIDAAPYLFHRSIRITPFFAILTKPWH